MTFSTLSDSIYFNHYWLDTADRIFAVIGAGYLIYPCFFSWLFLLEVEELLAKPTFLKVFLGIFFALPPVWFLNNSRKNPVRSEEWRRFHIGWHVSGAIGGTFCILLGAGWFDVHLLVLL